MILEIRVARAAYLRGSTNDLQDMLTTSSQSGKLTVPIRGRSNDSAAEPTEEALKSMADHLADYGTRLVDDVELLCKRLLHYLD